MAHLPEGAGLSLSIEMHRAPRNGEAAQPRDRTGRGTALRLDLALRRPQSPDFQGRSRMPCSAFNRLVRQASVVQAGVMASGDFI